MSTIVCTGFLVLFTCQVPDAPKTTVTGCARESVWTNAYQDKLFAEVSATPKGSATRKALAEHIRLRDQAKACRGAKK